MSGPGGPRSDDGQRRVSAVAVTGWVLVAIVVVMPVALVPTSISALWKSREQARRAAGYERNLAASFAEAAENGERSQTTER
jgi:hypothetical protein